MFLRARQFNHALKMKNMHTFKAAQSEIRKNLKKLPKNTLSENGRFLQETDIEDWLFDVATLQFMLSGSRPDPTHYEGGASVAAYILTLWGRRSTTFLNLDGTSTVMESQPGSLYTSSSLCAAEHFVSHREQQIPTELLNTACGACEVVLCVRSRVFRANRSSVGKVGPAPKAVASIVSEATHKIVSSEALLLPTLEECKQARPEIKNDLPLPPGHDAGAPEEHKRQRERFLPTF